MTERRIVVIAFFAFLAVGSAVILVYAAQPTSHPSIQSGRGAATTRSHRAATSSTTPGTLPQPPTEVEGESANSGTAMPASTTAPATTAPPTAAAPPGAELLTAAPPTMAPPAIGAARDRAADDAPPAIAPPTTTPPTIAPPTIAPHTTAPPTTAPPSTKKVPPGLAKK